MKVTSIKHKQSLLIKGVRYGSGDEEALDKVLSESAKKRYAELGIIEIERESKKRDEV